MYGFRLGETKEVMSYMNSTDGQEVDAHDLFQTTPLVWGARNGHDETVKYLSSIKADVNATGFGGWSAATTSKEKASARCCKARASSKSSDVSQRDCSHCQATGHHNANSNRSINN